MYKVALRIILKSGARLDLNQTCETREAAESALAALAASYVAAEGSWYATGFDDDQQVLVSLDEIACVSVGIWG